MEPRLKRNKNVLAWMTCGGGSGLKFFKHGNFIST